MKILVTGGAGFVGSNLVEALLHAGHDVHVLENYSTGWKRVEGAFYYYGDVRNLDDFGTAWIKDYEIIYHLAALARIQPSFKNPVETIGVNAHGTLACLEFAKRCGARFIYAGSSSVYHDIYANPYSYSKWLGEEHCRLYNKIYGLSTVIARFFNVYGPGHIADGPYSTVIAIFEKQKKEGRPLTVTGDGEQRRDFTHVADIANGLVKLAEKEYNAEVFNFGTGTNYSINEVAAMFKPVGIEYIDRRPGEVATTLADISMSQTLGWKPTISLEEYVSHEISS